MQPEKPTIKEAESSPELIVKETTSLVTAAEADEPTAPIAHFGGGEKGAQSSAQSNDQNAGFEFGMAADLASGAVFAGKYKILGKLDSGGMSVVYKAQDLLLNRLVALKVLAGRQALDQKNLLRFQQEAKALGALTHAGIVGVHEFAIAEDGQQYLVMDYVEGQSLSDLIAKHGQLPVEQCLDIAVQVASALSYAHKRGVVHRDLKPSNIVLGLDERGKESVKLVDFGIAKISTPVEGQALTQTGEIFGSPLYMSPEQCGGLKIDERTDVYSLGCVIYEMLTGCPPHIGDTALATAVKHLQSIQEPLSVVRPDLQFSDRLEALVARTLEKNADSRYQSMLDLCGDLEMLRAGGKPRHPIRQNTGQQSAKPRITVPLVILIVVVFFGAGALLKLERGGLLFHSRPADQVPSASSDDGKKRILNDGFTVSQYQQTIAMVKEQIRSDKGTDQHYVGDLYKQIGKCYEKLGQWKEAEPYYEYAIKIYIDHPGDVREDEARMEYADVLSHLGQTEKAAAVLAWRYHPQSPVNPITDRH